MPLQATSGAASYDGFGGGVPFTPTYIEDVFSTWLYTGNDSTQTITNGIDLSGKGGLTWIKSRNQAYAHRLFDTARGANYFLISNTSDASTFDSSSLTAFNSNGFTLGNEFRVNAASTNYASWTFRKQPKFFDVVTYTGNGSNRTIAHSLGSVPGCIIVKKTSATQDWLVYHRSLGADGIISLNSTAASSIDATTWNNTTPTSTVFSVGATSDVNNNGATYVAYLFAHNAGGFGLTGTDNVISCGSYTGTGAAGNTITLGYEPQWLMIKRAVGGTSSWNMYDTMRGMPVPTAPTFVLQANLAGAEYTGPNNFVAPNATGFDITSTSSDVNTNGDTYIYIAIRRGPMKTPTSGTSVFSPIARSGTGTNPTVVTTTNNPDLLMSFPRTASPSAYGMCFWDKLRGTRPMLQSSITDPETNTTTSRVLQSWLNTGYQAGADFIEGYLNYSGSDYVNYPITRAPGFFDVVCYTGDGASPRSINHNLGVAPQLWIVKSRTAGATLPDWWIGTSVLPLFTAQVDLNFDNTAAQTNNNVWNDTLPTSTVFYTGNALFANESGYNYVAYLFASCPGVSKVGSYTGTGALQTINCGFTGGARFVLIKRTDSNGDWYVWDSARGIVAGNDPYLLLNSTAAEVTNTDYIDTYSAGFEISSTAPAAINANGGTYIFLAIA